LRENRERLRWGEKRRNKRSQKGSILGGEKRKSRSLREKRGPNIMPRGTKKKTTTLLGGKGKRKGIYLTPTEARDPLGAWQKELGAFKKKKEESFRSEKKNRGYLGGLRASGSEGKGKNHPKKREILKGSADPKANKLHPTKKKKDGWFYGNDPGTPLRTRGMPGHTKGQQWDKKSYSRDQGGRTNGTNQ